jgi:hypothetical protein
MTTDIHSCSYYCDRPECVKAQRDELRDRLESIEELARYSGKGLRAWVSVGAWLRPGEYIGTIPTKPKAS